MTHEFGFHIISSVVCVLNLKIQDARPKLQTYGSLMIMTLIGEQYIVARCNTYIGG